MPKSLNKTVNAWPKVSVIIPYREDRGWLQEAVESVQKQVYAGEIEIVKAHGDATVSVNLNTGIAACTGSLITYLCEDDLLPPDAIALSAAAFAEDAGIDFIHGHAENFGSDRNVTTWVPKVENPMLADMLPHNAIHGGTVMYRAEFFEKYGGYNTDLLTGEEYEIHLRALSQGARIGYVPQVLYRYRLHPKQKHRMHLLPNGQTREQHINAFKAKYK